ncbi:MAG: tRNA uridine-5-carboxymethylaminomethyl(34) synthesis GTPase MnmE [Hoeflea sp.]|nr:tRNA uridine-5-carboxymethylaminomethyl(34) synthesis GTPase MnmE [Hoeflea sp.]
MRDTIFALSSGAPPAGVAIIRVSGPQVRFVLETILGEVPQPRMARLAKLRDASGEVLDHGLSLFFPSPHSFTGEDVAELQIHGGRASISAVLSRLSDLPGLRHAEAGEFTKRAFESGRMDLTAVEGLSDLIRAETEAQRKQAMGQAEGVLGSLYSGWAHKMTHARAMVEAELDFSDEDDIPGAVSDRIWPEMQALLDEMKQHLSRARAGEIVRDGFRIALIGPPNAGKSSLLNALVKRDVAIVSDIAGTTRDIVEVRLDIGGHLVLVQDTAGIRSSEDQIELEGIRRSLRAAEEADLVLELRDATVVDAAVDAAAGISPNRLLLLTKSDLRQLETESTGSEVLTISAKTGSGIDFLMEEIKNRIGQNHAGAGEALPTRDRHIQYLKTCVAEAEKAVIGRNLPIEVRSEYLRNAATALGRITGKVDVEDLLGVIFSEFCVGK